MRTLASSLCTGIYLLCPSCTILVPRYYYMQKHKTTAARSSIPSKLTQTLSLTLTSLQAVYDTAELRSRLNGFHLLSRPVNKSSYIRGRPNLKLLNSRSATKQMVHGLFAFGVSIKKQNSSDVRFFLRTPFLC